ncbi:hypothetical protein EJB05_50409, partial [Eragrostis curvula]
MSLFEGIKRNITGKSRVSSSHSGSDSSIPSVHGAPPPAIAPVIPPPPVELILRVLEQCEHVIPRSEEERNRIEALVDREFQHSRVFDPQLLHVISLLKDFESALRDTLGQYRMIYHGYSTEIDLTEPRLGLYRSDPVYLLDPRKAEPARHSVAEEPLTRARTRARNQHYNKDLL